ncbi:MAG: CoA transferase [Alphaproteobacteria bacterium]|nr:CoA transferase [Alphaproteobacteria bacterium]
MAQEHDDTDPVLPLAGVRVLDFSRLLPGPWATQMLAEMGADVVKIEQPGIGDPSRHNRPSYRKHSVYFNVANGSKRSLTLDLRKPEGREIGRKLVHGADVIVESFRPGVARKLGIDYPSVREINLRAIHCSITGFGQTGPLAHIAGHDLVLQGMTSLMGCALEHQNPPAVPGFQSADFAGALFAVIGIQAALAKRDKTGEGCEIDLGMFESLFSMCFLPLSSALARASGREGEPRMESFGGNPRYATYLSRDGKPVAVSLLETKAWVEFCRRIGRPDLVSENETPADRLSAHGALGESYRQALTEYCAAHDWADLMRALEETGIAICPICTPEEALALPQVAARGLVAEIDHPLEGSVRHLVNPLWRAGLAEREHRPAPDLGEHNDEILRELGYAEEAITLLKRDGVV